MIYLKIYKTKFDEFCIYQHSNCLQDCAEKVPLKNKIASMIIALILDQ
jgi:hypothetical protein